MDFVQFFKKGLDNNQWIGISAVVIKSVVSPALLFMPKTVEDAGYLFGPIVMGVMMIFIFHGTIVLTSVKYMVGPYGGRNEGLSFAQASETMGEGAPDTLKEIGVHFRNVIYFLQFIVHIFKCAVYLVIMATLVDAMDDIIDPDPWNIRPHIGKIGAIMLCIVPFAQVPYISTFLTMASTGIMMVIFLMSFKLGEINSDPLVTVKLADRDRIPLSVGQMAFAMSFYSPIINSELRSKDRTYIVPYMFGMIAYTGLMTFFGVGCYLYYQERTQNLIVFNMENDSERDACLWLAVVANGLYFIPELRQGVKALEIDFSNWKQYKCFPYLGPIFVGTLFHFSLGLLIMFIALIVPHIGLLSAFTGAVFVLLVASMMPTVLFIIKVLWKDIANRAVKMMYLVFNLVILIATSGIYAILLTYYMMYLFANYDMLTESKIYT